MPQNRAHTGPVTGKPPSPANIALPQPDDDVFILIISSYHNVPEPGQYWPGPGKSWHVTGTPPNTVHFPHQSS